MNGVHEQGGRDCSVVHDVVGESDVVDAAGVKDVVETEYWDAVLDADLAVEDQDCSAVRDVSGVAGAGHDQPVEGDGEDKVMVPEGHGLLVEADLLA